MEKKEHKKCPAQRDASHKKNWREVYATVEDIQRFLGDQMMLRYNVITRRVECHLLNRSPWDSYDGSEESAMDLLMAIAEQQSPGSGKEEPMLWRPVTDRLVNSLWKDLSKEKPVRAQDIYPVP